MPTIICPHCQFANKTFTKEEIFGEKYLPCLCGKSFKNINYNVRDNNKKILVEKNTTLI